MEKHTNNEIKKDLKEIPPFLIENHIKKNIDFYHSIAPAGFKIKFGKTFCFYLETNEIEVSPEFLIKKYSESGISPELVEAETVIGVAHEINHFKEKINLLKDRENGGQKAWQEFLNKQDKDETYSFFDDQFSNIKMNKGVLQDTNKAYLEAIQSVYKDAFKDYDFKKNPKHIQFCQALQLDQPTGFGENIDIDEDVRVLVEEIKNIKIGEQNLIDLITNPNIKMSDRLLFQDAYIYPIVERLKKEDKENEQNKDNKNGDNNQDSQSSKNSEKQESSSENIENKTNSSSSNKTKKNPEQIKADKDFEEKIQKIYEQIKEKEGKIPWEKSDEDLAKEYEKIIGDPQQKEAEKHGISVDEYKKNRKIQKEVLEIKNPETNRSIVEELREIFEKIISKRTKPVAKPKYPVNLSHGDIIVDPVKIFTDTSAGDMDPKVSEIIETKEKKGDFVGKVEITVVADRSGSMSSGGKKESQLKAIALMIESMAFFNKDLQEISSGLQQTLQIDTEVMAFNGEQDVELIKKSSDNLSEKDRAEVYAKLQTTPGSTTEDYKVLKDINNRLSIEKEKLGKINEGEIIKIVIVFTDGQSASVPDVQRTMQDLIAKKVIVCGVGISEDGEDAKETYRPNGYLCENPSDLPVIMGQILKEHLKDI